MRQIVLAITGASGAPYAVRLARLLVEANVHLHVVATPYGRQVLAEETDIKRFTPEALFGQPRTNATFYNVQDLGARISSGSFITHGMVVCPCSSNTLSAIGAGLADNLVTRAAAVTLKESRRLILVPREMPLNAIELEWMLKLSRLGVVMCPAAPGFYNRPKSINDLIDFVCGRVLDLLGIEHRLAVRWDPGGPTAPPSDNVV